jgi:curved DNA-binding protein CbpA
MNEQYAKNYQILGLQSGATWSQVRQAYKSLVNTWHPDRFQQNARQQKLAEEKTKEITQSYQELAAHYKKFGELPRIETKIISPHKNEPTTAPDTRGTAPAQKSWTAAHPQTDTNKSPRFTARNIAFAALVIVAYFSWQSLSWEQVDNAPSDANHFNQAPEKQKIEAPVVRESGDEEYFTFGMLPGEVYAIQGVPTRTEKDTWYYGKSKVIFLKGRVARWEEDPENLLRVRISAKNENLGITFFSVGSSKKEVLAAQGKPDRDTGNIWEYGVSRVYFENERVKKWDESPFSPLRVRQ